MKCSKHPDKEAAAICERCNLLYCGNCVLSSNGKCPKCGNTLRSPQGVLPYEIYQDELYKGRGQPSFIEAINSIYIEPEREMKQLKEYASLFTGFINITILYIIITAMRIILTVVIASGVIPMTGSNANLLGVQTIFAFIIVTILYFGVLIFGWLFSSFIYFLPAKLLGGTGEFVHQASLLSYIMLAVLPLELFSLALIAIPVLGLFIGVAATIAVFFYSIFLICLSIRVVNGFNTLKTLASFIISSAIFLLLNLLLIALAVLIFAMPFIGNLPHPSL
jgi:hypothetical protein